MLLLNILKFNASCQIHIFIEVLMFLVCSNLSCSDTYFSIDVLNIVFESSVLIVYLGFGLLFIKCHAIWRYHRIITGLNWINRTKSLFQSIVLIILMQIHRFILWRLCWLFGIHTSHWFSFLFYRCLWSIIFITPSTHIRAHLSHFIYLLMWKYNF